MITTHYTKGALGCYAPPKCSIITVNSEGVLCSSFNSSIESLGNSVDYVWGEEE